MVVKVVNALAIAHFRKKNLKMDDNIFKSKDGERVIVDNWSDGKLSYALILYPNNVLHLQWMSLNK
jgi:hypothetical protein